MSDSTGDLDDDAATSKVWAVYVSEAEKYDRSLVESWKSDMEGMLIFAGLFSASLTAFIIESYKTLNPDSGESTVQLLAQISQQLAAAANGSTFHVPAPTHSPPRTTSLVCNALWFISLGLSLACAMIATLLEQWARDFLHKADMRSAPVIRARVFSFLYYGLKRFNMHTVVDIIPLLLHTSLIFFFAGLIAFLFPINPVITYIAVGLLVVVVAAYGLLTVLPIWYLDCPYRTPLSTTFWSLSQFLSRRWLTRHTVWRRNAVEAMFDQAMTASPARTDRDYRALVWTLRSLSDNTELEPFIEGIPDLLRGPPYTRETYTKQLQQLAQNRDVALLPRIEQLVHSCRSGLLSEQARKHRETTCYKALWVIASIQTPAASSAAPGTPLPLDFWSFPAHYEWPPMEPSMDHYSRSAILLMRRSALCRIGTLLTQIVDDLSRDVSLGHAPNLESFKLLTKRQHWSDINISFFMPERLLQYCDGDTTPVDTSDLVADIVQTLERISIQQPLKLFLEYCTWAATQEALPYRFFDTQKIILSHTARPTSFSIYGVDLEFALADIVYPIPLDHPKWNEPTAQCFDIIIQQLCALWSPEDSDSRPIPRALARYVAARKDKSVIHDCLISSGIIPRLLRAIPATLSDSASFQYPWDDAMTTLWHAVYCGETFLTLQTCQSILNTIPDAPITPAGFSSIAMIKTALVRFVDKPAPLLESVPTPEAEANPTLIHFLAEFLEGQTSDFMPYEPGLTMYWIISWLGIPAQVDETQQLRLAASLTQLLATGTDNSESFEVLDTLINSYIFMAYQREGSFGLPEWLDNPTARNQIKSTLSSYLQRPGSTLTPESASRLQEIFTELESRHPAQA
ncbi:hypothetical protein B0H16DRAFT_1698022 [Mycena metata]|uniref:DUF6535 domain-containing protein n=1 Tax=Mycena metata TaxID=1033252 RepID=A0AAD7MPU0_9AGAR|nr:hypothetical protein B0H16DRAFT_1698022 [Mycena metata]